MGPTGWISTLISRCAWPINPAPLESCVTAIAIGLLIHGCLLHHRMSDDTGITLRITAERLLTIY
jgi:hypothetical protein